MNDELKINHSTCTQAKETNKKREELNFTDTLQQWRVRVPHWLAWLSLLTTSAVYARSAREGSVSGGWGGLDKRRECSVWTPCFHQCKTSTICNNQPSSLPRSLCIFQVSGSIPFSGQCPRSCVKYCSGFQRPPFVFIYTTQGRGIHRRDVIDFFMHITYH